MCKNVVKCYINLNPLKNYYVSAIIITKNVTRYDLRINKHTVHVITYDYAFTSFGVFKEGTIEEALAVLGVDNLTDYAY